MTIKWGRLCLSGKRHLFTQHLAGTNTRACCRNLSLGQILLDDKVLLEDHNLKVPSFGGSLWIQTPVDVTVKPVNRFEDMRMDKANVKFYGKSEGARGKLGLELKQEGHKLTIAGTAHQEEAAREIHGIIEVPLVHNVNVIAEGEARIRCEDMVESNFCHLTSEDGNVNVRRLKTANLLVQSESGDIVCNGAIQGSVSLVTGSGNVISDKRFLGPNLDVTTDTGDIRIASSYSDQSKFSTHRGNLYLRNIHNESYVAVYESGSVNMMGVDGCTNVFVKKGDVEIQVSQVKYESRIHVEEGDITLKIADNFPIKVCVTANEIILDTKFSGYGKIENKEEGYRYYMGTIQPEKFSPTIQVVAENGRAIIESQDWAASLGFKLPGTVQIPTDLKISQ